MKWEVMGETKQQDEVQRNKQDKEQENISKRKGILIREKCGYSYLTGCFHHHLVVSSSLLHPLVHHLQDETGVRHFD